MEKQGLTQDSDIFNKPPPPSYGQSTGQPAEPVWYPPQDQYPPQGLYQYPPPPVVTHAPIPGPQIPGRVIVVQGRVTPGPYPYQTVCSNCRTQIITETTPVSGSLTWLAAAAIFLLGGVCGCCCIPFCVDSCQDIEHRCPNCKLYLGSHRRLC
ncbi:Lipopolysaccharide-induced tumor necrosis factor-alpha factor -like protein [Halotydeus destructor]|nr:Lipopolysaccharide-induced tumor necrosis factor-alpha factor -like protein [Halotydeus destructor]